MNIALFEDHLTDNLYPLTWLRPAFELVCGRDRLIDKLRRHLGDRITGMWLREVIRPAVWERFEPEPPQRGADWCLVNARTLLTGDVKPPPAGTAWYQDGVLVAVTVRAATVEKLTWELFQDPAAVDAWLKDFRRDAAPDAVRLVRYPWELPLANREELLRQCQVRGANDGTLYAGAHLLCPEQIQIARGAVVKPGAVLDAEQGPIVIDRDVRIGANAVVEGPCYIGPEASVYPVANIRPGTTIGPACRVGGEVSATIFQGYANKQHDGFLGHSYVAPWVNLGAATVTSNLKNTYGAIRVSINGVGVETGELYIGATIGDHVKTGIGTILPTGCVLGVAANVFTRGPLPKFVPSFAWLTDAGMEPFRVDKAIHIARMVMGRRNGELSEIERVLLERTAELARRVEAAGWR